MKLGTLYGIGVGPGDPDLITVKGANILASCPHVFVPKAKQDGDSTALKIAQKFIRESTQIHEIVFPMITDKELLTARWTESAKNIASVLKTGEDAAFLTLGDAFLYSTYIYMLRSLKLLLPELNVITVPGITAFSACAATSQFPIGEGKEPVTIIPTADDLDAVRNGLHSGGTLILMKIGKRLGKILDVLESAGALGRSVFISHVGMDNEQVITNLESLRGAEEEAGYLSIILVRGKS